MPATEPRDTHLFVLVHGLWGGPNHMLTIDKSIRELLEHEQSTERIATIRPSSFRFWKTYDGLKLNAERVISDILYEVEMIKQKQNSRVTKISFVGYSLGGLISRCVIGELNGLGFFDNIKPIFFTTFATPHVGIHFFKQGLFDKVANHIGRYIFGKSGSEMFINDSEKILVEMANPEKKWLTGLKLFEKHLLLANIKNDRTVAFFTSYITDYSPFEEWNKIKVKYLKHLPQVRIGKVEVRPKFVDFERCKFLDVENEFENQQEETSFFRRSKFIRFLLIFFVSLFVLPLWIPFVMSSTIFVSIYSAVKIRVIKSPEIKQHWNRVKGSVYGKLPIDEEDTKIGQKNREQRKKLRHNESFKADTSDFTESAVDNFIYVEQRLSGNNKSNIVATSHDDDDEEEDREEVYNEYPGDDTLDEYEVADDEDDEAPTGDMSPVESTKLLDINAGEGATNAQPHGVSEKEKIIHVKIEENVKSVDMHVEKLYNQDYGKYPVFTKDSKLDVDHDRKYIIENLNSIDWIKIPVYIDAWNAHDGIVARRGPRTNPKGTATILLWATILRQHTLGKLSK